MKRKQSYRLADLFLHQVMSGIEGYGGTTPKDDRCLDLWEALERYARDAMKGKAK